jgi:putative glycosyltransferase (TIGR04372 family)
MDPDSWFVTLHVRDNFFDKPGYGRNADVLSYLPAIKEIISKGGVVIRIGDSNSKKLPKMKGYLDATGNTSKNGKLDIFLLSNCRFMIGTLSGPLIVPQTFGVPVLSTNAPDFYKNILLPNSLVIPKLIRDSTGRLLTFHEIFNETELWTDSYLPSFNQLSLSWVDNSQEDILMGVCEMIDGKNLKPTVIQKSLISKFRENKTTTLTPVSQNFLNKYESLFAGL